MNGVNEETAESHKDNRQLRIQKRREETILDKSVETIVENRITSRKLVVCVKFQAPSSPIQC